MTTPEERDFIGEVIREDAANRKSQVTVIACKIDESCGQSLESKNAELRQKLADVSHERDLLRAALGGMLFEFDDGVGEDWSSDLLDHARTLCDAIEFKLSAEVNS